MFLVAATRELKRFVCSLEFSLSDLVGDLSWISEVNEHAFFIQKSRQGLKNITSSISLLFRLNAQSRNDSWIESTIFKISNMMDE